MKDKKRILLIGGIILVIIFGVVLYFCFFYSSNKLNSKEVNDKIVAPVGSTEELIKEMKTIDVVSVTDNEIEFSDNIELKENQKVAVWIYSEPKFLGYFEVLVENGIKKIVGLKEAIEKIIIEDGKHNIAITTELGKPIGYINVLIENDNILMDDVTELIEEKEEVIEEKKDNVIEEIKEQSQEKINEEATQKTITKQITETETIWYSSIKQNEVNMKRGETKVVQAGVNGMKDIIYDVTYDSNGNELSRIRISERIITEAVNEIIKVGSSDFNINSDFVTFIFSGFMCTESDFFTTSSGSRECDDSKALKTFRSISINDINYLVDVENTIITPINLTFYQDSIYKGTYQGVVYYFDARSGDDTRKLLTMDECNKYGFSCGAW